MEDMSNYAYLLKQQFANKINFRCQCMSGFYGIHCTKRSLDCNSGTTEICGHGFCINQKNGVKCICDQVIKSILLEMHESLMNLRDGQLMGQILHVKLM